MSKPIRLTIYDPEKDRYYSAIKILSLSDGGFSIVFPRFVGSNIGLLEKIAIDYADYGTKIEIAHDSTEQYRTDDIVKFSYHNDGFVQVSSATNSKIRSGRDRDDNPKGLGIKSWPLSDPIRTGPSFALSIWGLDNLAEQEVKKVDSRFTFRTDAANTLPAYNLGDGKREMFGMEIYVIQSASTEKSIVKSDNDGSETAFMSMMQDREDLSFFLRLRRSIRIIRLTSPDIILGISWMRFLVDESKSNYGYHFASPSDGKNALLATYPLDAHSVESPLKDITYRGSNMK